MRQVIWYRRRIDALMHELKSAEGEKEEALFQLYHDKDHESKDRDKFPRPVLPPISKGPVADLAEAVEAIDLTQDTADKPQSMDEVKKDDTTPEERAVKRAAFIAKFKARIVKKKLPSSTPVTPSDDEIIIEAPRQWERL